MKYIMTIVWALLIGAALAYILSSMAGDTFNMVQSIVYSGVVFIIILIMDNVLSVDTEQ
ncbi:MAG TPA: DUF2929 family protein [Pseudogracilibacillus sp.]|nr:DUF2929 family protein [Pseudogracilibacillus sp.]